MMHHFLKILLSFFIFTFISNAKSNKIDFSLVISGGVSLGAYEAGYNWSIIKILKNIKRTTSFTTSHLESVAGASAGSINALLSAMYWCQKDSIPLKNSVDDNLFYETWVNLGIEDLRIKGRDAENKSSLLTQKGLREKGKKIISHMNKNIYTKNCAIPLGVSVTKTTPINETISGIQVRNQNFSVPLTFKEKNGRAIVSNKKLPPSSDFYISIPNIDKDKNKLIDLLLASGAFPGAFQQIKLTYKYKDKIQSNYFIDGGLYDNIPLDLVIALNKKSSTFLFISPSNIRKEQTSIIDNHEEKKPIGFIKTNLLPVFSSFDIMQSTKLYQAVNQNFRGNSNKKLLISSRYHPITGMYLGHFAAFFDKNFRLYDYYVGVYDAILNISNFLKKRYPQRYKMKSVTDMMNTFMKSLNIDKKPEAYAAYQLFLKTEFQHIKPQTIDRFSSIYNAFNTDKSDATRYSNQDFEYFLEKLDMQYIKTSKDSFLAHAKKNVKNWYKKPLKNIINRITILENDQADFDPNHKAVSQATNIAAWLSSSFTKEKTGFHFSSLDLTQEDMKEEIPLYLKFLPNDISADIKKGGLSFGYTGTYYNQNIKIFDGLEVKGSYIISDFVPDFLRFDTTLFKEFDNTIKIGIGASFFGNTVGAFYEQESALGYNAYIDIIDIFRLTYVHRTGHLADKNYVYFGIESIPSLIYWLNR